ncbi:hypothetical protein [Polaromonas sp. CG9_12]|nr:hypothetical protein [Polaromonas sp. CG9_12]
MAKGSPSRHSPYRICRPTARLLEKKTGNGGSKTDPTASQDKGFAQVGPGVKQAGMNFGKPCV